MAGPSPPTSSPRRLSRRIKRDEATITVVDWTGNHVYQPGFMYIAMGGEKADKLQRPERALLDKRVELVVGEVSRVDELERTVVLSDGRALRYDYLVLATGSRITPDEIPHYDDRGAPLLQRAGPRASCATRWTPSPVDGSWWPSPACRTSARRPRWRCRS